MYNTYTKQLTMILNRETTTDFTKRMELKSLADKISSRIADKESSTDDLGLLQDIRDRIESLLWDK